MECGRTLAAYNREHYRALRARGITATAPLSQYGADRTLTKKKSSVAKQQRRKLSAEFKAKVALAALREDRTLADICAEFKVHSTQISDWKRHLVEHAVEGFARRGGAQRVAAIDVTPLHAKIGELTLENDFLERALSKAGLLSARQ